MKQIALFLVTAAALLAQRSEIVRIEHQPPEKVWNLITPMMPNGTKGSWDNSLKVITLSGPPEVVEMLINNIHRLDVAPSEKNIELTVDLIIGGNDEAPVRNELAATVKQLKSTFSFKGYKEVDTVILRASEGKMAEAKGILRIPGISVPDGSPEAPSGSFEMAYYSSGVRTDGQVRSASLNDFRFKARLPESRRFVVTEKDGSKTDRVQHNFVDASLRGDVSIKEGQRVVLGKSALAQGKEALFVVLSVRITD